MRSILSRSAFGLLVFYGIFGLPFLFPPQHPSSSPTYVAGFNNRVSVLVTLAASLAALSYFSTRRSVRESGLVSLKRSETLIPLWTFAVIAAIYTVVLTAISLIADLSPVYLMADARYFLHLVSEIQFFGRRPYTDFDYAYGPLLLYGPVWFYRAFRWTGITLEISYYVVTNLQMIAGLYLLRWLINQLYPAGWRSRWLFINVGLGTLYLTLGANGTFIRFLFTFSALVYLRVLERRPNIVILTCYLAACQWIAAMISPEIGVSFLAASLVYAVARCRVKTWSSLVLIAGPLLGAGMALLSFGSLFLHSILEFSSGSLNWVIVPYPPLLLYLVVVIVLAPAAVAALWRSKSPDCAIFAAYYVCGLALVPAALGRCDFVHLLFDGMGLIILAFAHMGAWSRRVQTASLATLAICMFAFQIMWVIVSRHDLLNPAFDALSALVPAPTIDRWGNHFGPLARETAKLRKIATRPVTQLLDVPLHVPIATPWMLDKRSDQFLGQRGNHQPEFYTDFINVATPEGEQRKIDALSEHRWALVPRSPSTWIPSRDVLAVRFLYPLSYRERNAPYPTAKGTLDYLHAHYRRVRDVGDYTLWERN